MANGKAHSRAGAVAGGLTAACYAPEQPAGNVLLEVLGGVGGGLLGARLPDIIDPPTGGRHRSVGHGMLPMGACGLRFVGALPALQTWLREQAKRQRRLADASCDPLLHICHVMIQLLCTLGAGALAGLLGGYASHLVLDAMTPMGLPAIA
jgi:hypothetical protein